MLAFCTVVLLAVMGRGFSQSCDQPSFPTATPAPIDSTSCPLSGSGGAETNQNAAKNNFCASGTAQPMTIAQLAALQQQVQQNKSIPFGNEDAHPFTKSSGPATDRAPLAALGEGSEVVLTGYVKVSRQEGAESVNCGKGGSVPDEPAYHDIHIAIVASPANAECTGVVVEMTPRHRPATWSADLVNEVAAAKVPVRVTGQLMFDSSHSPCQNGKPVGTDPSRISLWEVHPIYQFEVCTQGDCSSGSGWVALETWKPSAKKPSTKTTSAKKSPAKKAGS
jgi:hypothetical protein